MCANEVHALRVRIGNGRLLLSEVRHADGWPRGLSLGFAVPTYDYQCRNCGFITEVVHSMLEDGPTECERCGGQLRRVFHPTGIIFKGGGFYKTDSRSAKSGDGAGSSGGSSGRVIRAPQPRRRPTGPRATRARRPSRRPGARPRVAAGATRPTGPGGGRNGGRSVPWPIPRARTGRSCGCRPGWSHRRPRAPRHPRTRRRRGR